MRGRRRRESRRAQDRRAHRHRRRHTRGCDLCKRPGPRMGQRREDRTGTAWFLDGRSRRQVSCGGGNGFTQPQRAHLSRGAAARSAVQRGGCSGSLRFLLSRSGAAWRPSDRDFNRWAESIARTEASAATGTSVRRRIHGMGGAARRDQTPRSGKRCGKKKILQGEINFLMVALAASGLRVVRLKGGDPLIFGRAGEEIESLRRANIPYEIVPGVTSAMGAAAAAQIPLTHRRASAALVFITAHLASEKNSSY